MLGVLVDMPAGQAARKREWLGPAGAEGSVTQAQLTAFRAAETAIWDSQQCEMCTGFGHDANECPTRTKIDRAAAQNKCSWLWGAIKGACYYREWLYAGNRPPQPRRVVRVRRRRYN